MGKLTRKPKNLSLEPDAVARGERYSQIHGTNLSRLVDTNVVLDVILDRAPWAESSE